MKNLTISLISFLLLSTGLLVSAASGSNGANEQKCRPFVMSFSYMGYDVGFERQCYAQDASVVQMSISHAGKSVAVDSAHLKSNKVNVANVILGFAGLGLGPKETDRIVNDVGPALVDNDLVGAKDALEDLILTSGDN